MGVISLTQGKVASVDDGDFESLNKKKWFAMNRGRLWYAVRTEKDENGKTVQRLMHRTILSAPTGMDVDHINGDGLDNRRENLRTCSHAENCRNRGYNSNSKSGIKGVIWDKSRNKWTAGVKVDGKRYNLGRFSSKDEAVEVYRKALKHYHGEFAHI